MRSKLTMLFAFLPLFALFCAENNAATFISRIKGEIEAARANAANIRTATEQQWNTHNEKMTNLQVEADKLSNEIQALENEYSALRLEIQALQQKKASLKHNKSRMEALLAGDNGNSTAPLPEQLNSTITEKESLLQRLLAPPGTTNETDALDNEDKIIHGMAYDLGPLHIFTSEGKTAQLFHTSQSGLPKISGTLDEELPALDITGKHPELFAKNKGILEHMRKGGIMMFPIIALGLICIAILILKLREFTIKPLALDLQQLNDTAKNSTSKGEKLEEELFTLAQQLLGKRQHLLSWLGVSAATAPLLGLLGTVTGMIHTFQLITSVGVGDARLLADGISEALVTTEAGLCVAIPALLCHAWLSRVLRRHSTNMETEITKVTSD